jgi:hypothetical protein
MPGSLAPLSVLLGEHRGMLKRVGGPVQDL